MAYKISKWSLAPLYPGYESAELQNAFDMIEEQVTSFEGVREKLNPDIASEQFMEIIRASEETVRVAEGLLVELDEKQELAGLWLVGVPPFPADEPGS